MALNNDYGEKLKFDPQWKGPLGVARARTNYNWLVAFKIYFLVCMAISIYGLAANRTRPKDLAKSTIYDNYTREITVADCTEGLLLSIPFIVLATCLMFLYIYLLQRHAVLLTYSYTFLMFFISTLCLGVCVMILKENGKKLDEEQLTVLITVGLVALTFCIVPLGLMICCGSKIKLAAEVIREASKAVMHFPSLFVFPIISLVIQIFIIGFTFFVSFALYVPLDDSSNSTTQIVHYILIVIILFGGLWVLTFASDFVSMCLYGSFATWYWSIDKNTIPENTVSQIINIIMRYHLGSIAMGSLLLNLVQVILHSVVGLLYDGDSSGASSNHAAMCAGGLGSMIQSLLEYIGRNAYIFVASHGTGFWDSAKDAFNILKRNLMNIIVITEVSGGLVMIAQIFTVGITLLTAYGICYVANVTTPRMVIALILISIGSLFICGNICAVLNASIDTIFLSVLEDYERNDGSSVRPYFMSDKLKELLII